MVAVVPAAGRSERFGRQKLVELVDGEPLLNRTIRSLLDAGVASVVVVASPAGGLDAVPLLADPRVTQTINPDPSRGMLSSIQVGLAAAPEGDPVLILPGDMPFVRAATVLALLARPPRPGTVIAPRLNGRRGHPLALPRPLGSDILRADAHSNLSDLLTALGVERHYVEVDDPGIVRDVDIEGDLTQ